MMTSEEYRRALMGLPYKLRKDPKMTKMPPWMWLVGGLCMGALALGFAIFTTYLALLAPLIIMGLGFAYISGEQKTVRALAWSAQQLQQLQLDREMAELDKTINEPDQELERKFKALADAETANDQLRSGSPPKPLEEDDQHELRELIAKAVREHQGTRTPPKGRRSETRQLWQTVRQVVIKGDIRCSLTRPGRRVLIVQGTPSERRRLSTNLLNEVLTITYEDYGYPIQVEVCSQALVSVEVGKA